MQNFAIYTKELGKVSRCFEKGMSSTVEELLLSAEYIMSGATMR